MRQMKFFLCSVLLITLAACQGAPAGPDSSTPMLTVREATNCRTGPGTDYEIVFTYPSGTKLEITGRYESGNFWLVKSDKSATGTCWMWGQYVDVTGNSQAVPSVALPTPPPSTNGQTDRLFVENWEYTCDNGTLNFTLRWVDRATDESGYRIFRNGIQLVELPANSTSYADSFDPPAGATVEYYLQVFGPSGTLNSSVMKAGC